MTKSNLSFSDEELKQFYYSSSLKWQWNKPYEQLNAEQIACLQKLKRNTVSMETPSDKYDSKPDTFEHIYRVRELLGACQAELNKRGLLHDRSKLESPEKDLFDEFTPKLKGCTYGSDEYYEFLKKLKPALDHHYAHNSHHPEHYENGLDGFDLFDLVEMFADWKAASERHEDGDIFRSINQNEKRFNMDPQVANIFRNTAKRMFGE